MIGKQLAFATVVMFAVNVPLALSAPTPKPWGGGGCDGDPGYELDMPTEVEIGSQFRICVRAPQDHTVFHFVSLGEGPTVTPYGTLCLDFPVIAMHAFQIPRSGERCTTHRMSCDESLVGMTGYFQFLAINLTTLESGVSNQVAVTVLDADCGG